MCPSFSADIFVSDDPYWKARHSLHKKLKKRHDGLRRMCEDIAVVTEILGNACMVSHEMLAAAVYVSGLLFLFTQPIYHLSIHLCHTHTRTPVRTHTGGDGRRAFVFFRISSR